VCTLCTASICPAVSSGKCCNKNSPVLPTSIISDAPPHLFDARRLVPLRGVEAFNRLTILQIVSSELVWSSTTSRLEMLETCGEERASKRPTADSCNPLHHKGILQLVLDCVGPGEHAFVSTVSKNFRVCYLNVADFEGVPRAYEEQITVVHDMTTYSSVFRSLSRLRWAAELGFVLDPESEWCQFTAGQTLC
jgi:hypothetical protein